ncbi:MAG: hypothetical protein RL172_2256 [Bacteroidota bacterium]|jgi:peptidoglycan/LPS O-acetylase OafA/YrhL
MDIRIYIYLTFLTTAFIVSLFNYKNDKGLKLITILLLLSVITDFTALIFKIAHINNANHFVLYHLFTPVEFILIGRYYYVNAYKPVIKKVIVSSVIMFFVFSIIVSSFVIPITKYPSLNNQVGYLLLTCISVLILFDLDPESNVPLHQKALFWIATGFTIYCTGIFFFNSLYNYLKDKNPNLAREKFNLINSIFNNTLYTLISMGFLCSKKTKTYT